MIHKFGLRHIKYVSLHEGEIKYVMNNIILNNIKYCTLFPSLGFNSKGFLLVRS